jgi:hypothetical protein
VVGVVGLGKGFAGVFINSFTYPVLQILAILRIFQKSEDVFGDGGNAISNFVKYRKQGRTCTFKKASKGAAVFSVIIRFKTVDLFSQESLNFNPHLLLVVIGDFKLIDLLRQNKGEFFLPFVYIENAILDFGELYEVFGVFFLKAIEAEYFEGTEYLDEY